MDKIYYRVELYYLIVLGIRLPKNNRLNHHMMLMEAYHEDTFKMIYIFIKLIRCI